MKSIWKIVLLFERRIEVDGRMVTTPFVKMRADGTEGDAVFAVHGGKVVYLPEKIDVRDTPSGQTVKHTVIAAESVVDTITAPDGTVFKQDASVDVSLTPAA
jgi:hypothetical protein